MSNGTEQRRLAAIMFTDMVGYSALSQRNEKLALELLAEQQRLLRTQFPLFNGREVKTTGDGFLVEFPSALEASQCAVEIQRAVVARNSTQPLERHIHVRIGIHVGDVVHREADMYGDGVNIAARIEPLAKGGGICLSDAVYGQVRNKLGVLMTKLDSPELKHIEVPMDVYRVILPWQQQAPVADKSVVPRRLKPGGRAFALGSAVAVVVGIAGWWFVHQPAREAKPTAQFSSNSSSLPSASIPAPIPDQKSIAVLPFANTSVDKGDDSLSEGMTDELINTLQKVKGLRVQGRTSSFFFKGKNETIQKMGEQLRVKYLLEGSVSKAGNKLRIDAALVAVADGFQLWSTNYDRDLSDIFAIRSDVANQVATALKFQLGVEEAQSIIRKPTESIEAYEFYLLGRQHRNKITGAGYLKAIEYFKFAIERDPAFALAYAGLADSYATLGLGIHGALAPNEAFPEAKKAAEKAIELNEGLAEAHMSLALVHMLWDWDWESTGKEFQRSLELNPNQPTALCWSGFNLDRMGRFEEGLPKLMRAKELDPLAVTVNLNVGVHFYYAQNYDQMIRQFQKIIEVDSNLGIAHWNLGRAYVQKARYQDAITEFRKAATLSNGSPRMTGSLGQALAMSGLKADAQRILDELQQLSKQEYVSPECFAFTYIGLGEKDKAFACLERAVAERAPMLFWLKVDPMYNSLHSDLRFAALLKELRLDE